MALTIDELFGSPDHYLHSFDGEQAVFVPMDRPAYRRSIFLDARIQPGGGGSMRVPAGMLAQAATGRPVLPTAWIFHVAHCGSTLLARALDRNEGALVLREPLALRQLALAPDPAGLTLVRAMLGKRYGAAPTLVKANVPVNAILPQIAAADPGAAAIFLYLPLADYLHAILRSAEHRGWLGRVTAQLRGWLGDLSGLSDGERAAALWLAQVRAFAAALAIMPTGRALDAEDFFARPAETLAAASALLGTPMDAAAVAEVVGGPLFATYSKNPAVTFDNAARLARRAETAAGIGEDLARAAAWLSARGTTEADELAPLTARALHGMQLR